ncbi:MAG TPA: DNA polymerase III subunit delta [Gemmataceae bacterium]|jgi:DNA polymerase-3 subunit delta|nr:DNA polymerase III subunit delta [Gemmataceae bacterium]
MDGLAFLERGGRGPPKPVYVLVSDEDFVKRQVLTALRRLVLGERDEGFGLSTHSGDKAVWATIHDELETLPFLGPRRLVVVENADLFVTRHRTALEKYVTRPAATGVLVLDVQSWPANTRLAKLIDPAATIQCKAPAAPKLPEWCIRQAAVGYGKELTLPAARMLVDLVGPEMGVLDQELAKLAAYAGEANRIDAADVDRLVGNSRAETTWKIFDAIGSGRPGEALAILDRLFDQGEDPLRILGAFSVQLRRLAQAARLAQEGLALADALDRVGVPPFAQKGCEQQLRHLGRRRANRLFEWLLETDLGLKGSSTLPPRTLLERLIVQLARKN